MDYTDLDENEGYMYGSPPHDDNYGSPPHGEKWEDEVLPSHNDFEYQDNQVIIDDCKELLKNKDFIMESNAIPTVNRFLSAGGYPQEFVQLLADNYHGTAQLANLLADWLIVSGASVELVQQLVESQLKEIILKNFDPKKADSIFTGAGQPPSWIEEMICHSSWRVMFYELAERFPDCLMLNFTLKLISDAGYETEIGSMASVCNQIEVFSKVLKTSIVNYFTHDPFQQKNMLKDFVKAICNNKHMYLYAQCMLAEIEGNIQNVVHSSCVRRLAQELSVGALNSGHDMWSLVLIFLGCGRYPRVFSSVMSLVEKRALNPGDITVLSKAYAGDNPPPVAFLRVSALLDMLTTALFVPGSSISDEHKSKYTCLLGYAVSVHESWNDGERDGLHKEELKTTVQAIDRVHMICCSDLGSSSLQFTADVGILYQCVRYPVVAMGILKWVNFCLSEKNYPKVITETVPLQIVLLDEICNAHQLHHPLVAALLKELFERNYPELDTLLELEFKKTVLDRMLHLISRGFIIPIVVHIKCCMDRQVTDVSLLRHFLAEVLEMIAPPYSPDFVAVLLPIAQNQEITSPLKLTDGSDDVSKFLAHCENG